MFYIYQLVCPIDGVVRYVGKAKDPEIRFRAHINNATSGRHNHHSAHWIRKLAGEGLRPRLELIYAGLFDEDWQHTEKEFIEAARSAGARLTNTTAGGDGFHGVSIEVVAKRVATRKARDEADPKRRERFLAGAKSETRRARTAISAKARWSDPEYKVRHAKAMKACNSSRAKAVSAYWSDNKAAMVDAINAPAARRAKSEKLKAAWADPEKRSRRLEKFRSQEFRDKMAAVNKANAARRRAMSLQEQS